MSSRFERLEARTVFEGTIVDVCEGTLPPRGRRGGHAPVGRAPRLGRRSSPTTASSVWLVRQPREATGEPDLLELPAGKLDEEGESPLECGIRELAEEIGKAAADWEHLDDVLHVGRLHRRAVPRLPRHRPARRARARQIAGERIDVEPHPLAELDATIAACRDAKTIIGLLLLRARLQAR